MPRYRRGRKPGGRDPTDNLSAGAREALIEATDHTLSTLSGRVDSVVLSVRPQEEGALVTLQARGSAEPPDPVQIASAARRIIDAEGAPRMEELQYIDLWVPANVTANRSRVGETT